jgi:hypothetical protein
MHACTHTEHVYLDRWTYILTSPPNRPIKVTPADHPITGSFMRPPQEGSRFYTIIPGAHGQARMIAKYIHNADNIVLLCHTVDFP